MLSFFKKVKNGIKKAQPEGQKPAVTKPQEENWTDTKAITRSTEKEHRIKWTIENISQLPHDTKIIGPNFYLTKSSLCNISFKKQGGNLYVCLCNKSDEAIRPECSVALYDSEGQQFHKEKVINDVTFEINKDIDIVGDVSISRFSSLKDDILIISCRLKLGKRYITEKVFFKTGSGAQENLINDLKAMFNDPVNSDFTIRVGGEFIHTHKALLCARSVYFKKMLKANMKESLDNFVSITDVSFPTMQKLVKFLYTGDFTEMLQDNDAQQISELYYAADKYGLMELRAFCAEKFLANATASNIFQVLHLARRHSDEDLKIRAMDFISYHFDEIEKSNTWKAFISREAVLGCEVLSHCFKRFKYTF